MTTAPSFIETLLAQAVTSRQRRLLVLAGDASWCRQQAVSLLAEAGFLARVVWVTDQTVSAAEVVDSGRAVNLLGQEVDAVVFDAHAGFDPDAFGAVSGIIVGGGLMLLLCPGLSVWPGLIDKATERIASWPYQPRDIGGRFIRRLVRLLYQAPGVTLVEQGMPWPSLVAVAAGETENVAPDNTCPDGIYRTPDQQQAVAAVEQVMTDSLPLVLVADRGRGKSAALGMAAARLLSRASEALRIVVTAPRVDAVTTLFSHAQALWPNAERQGNTLSLGKARLAFCPPDELCATEIVADLLLVDEAAAIPAALLQKLLRKYRRVVFSTTVHGYEGTGRGFAIRFRATLDSEAPGWRELGLRTPVRWAEQDPLEAIVFRILLLDADCATDTVVHDATPDTVYCACVGHDLLLENEAFLRQVFGLLVVAHYRTSPNDLRNLLDGPGLQIYVMTHRQQVVATALVAREGPFTQAMTEAIYSAQRRPRGNMIPQSLLAHAGLRDAGEMQCARVMRIAVHPALQQRGLGSRLMRHITEDQQSQGVDLLGASFGATVDLLGFWQQAGMQPVRVGFRRDHASGEHSVMVLRALSERGETVFTQAQTRFTQDLPHWLSDPLRELDSELAQSLLVIAQTSEQAGADSEWCAQHDREMLQGFITGQRSYEDSLGPLCRLISLCEESNGCAAVLPTQKLLLAKVRERLSWPALVDACGLSGRAEAVLSLRKAVETVLLTYTGQIDDGVD